MIKLNISKEEIDIFTDGSCSGNPGPGGWAGVIIHDLISILTGYETNTTNNRMELMAVIVGLESLKNPGMEVIVYSDSKYVVDAIEKKWLFNWEQKNFKGKKNKDLWERFLNVYNKHKVLFQWIKGHNKHPQNERCDELAVNAARGKDLFSDLIFEQTFKH